MSYFFDLLSNSSSSKKKQIEKNLNEIENTLKDIHLRNFVDAFFEVHNSNSEVQCLSYFGLNFEKGEIESIKFYAHIFNEMTENELLKFLPYTHDYFYFLDQKKSDGIRDRKNVGTVLEIKFKKGYNLPTQGFFYMLKHENSLYNYIDVPKHLPDEIANYCENAGINFEYNGNEKSKKLYYYFNNPTVNDFFKKKNGKSIKGSFVEYSEGSVHSKLNTYFDPIDVDYSFDKNINKVEIETIIRLSKKFGLKLFGQGSYFSNSINSYYLREYDSDKMISNELVHQHSNVFKKLKISAKK